MKDIKQVLIDLNRILKAASNHRFDLINSIKRSVYDDELDLNEDLQELVLEIFLDLEFYEPDPDKRKEDTLYYGDDELDKILLDSIKMIEYKLTD